MDVKYHPLSNASAIEAGVVEKDLKCLFVSPVYQKVSKYRIHEVHVLTSEQCIRNLEEAKKQ